MTAMSYAKIHVFVFQEAIEKLGYKPNAIAQGWHYRKRQRLSIVMSEKYVCL